MVHFTVRCPSLLLFKSVVKGTRMFEYESIKLVESEISWHAKGNVYRPEGRNTEKKHVEDVKDPP